VKGPLLLHSWPIFLFDLIDLPFVFIRPEAKEKSYKERFFHAMHNAMDSSNSMNEGRSMRKAGFLYEDSNKKEKGQTISY
jgi:hypothetical protein